MFKLIWPIALVVVSNIVYQMCTKSVPNDMSPFASLTVTYIIGAVISAVLYFAFDKSGSGFFRELAKLNWASLVLGVVIVGLEVGFIFAYKAGWQVSTASVVQSAVLSAALVFVGWLFYNEPISWNKLVGVAVCMVGLVFINME